LTDDNRGTLSHIPDESGEEDNNDDDEDEDVSKIMRKSKKKISAGLLKDNTDDGSPLGEGLQSNDRRGTYGSTKNMLSMMRNKFAGSSALNITSTASKSKKNKSVQNISTELSEPSSQAHCSLGGVNKLDSIQIPDVQDDNYQQNKAEEEGFVTPMNRNFISLISKKT